MIVFNQYFHQDRPIIPRNLCVDLCGGILASDVHRYHLHMICMFVLRKIFDSTSISACR
jgi:hypothetical protein